MRTPKSSDTIAPLIAGRVDKIKWDGETFVVTEEGIQRDVIIHPSAPTHKQQAELRKLDKRYKKFLIMGGWKEIEEVR